MNPDLRTAGERFWSIQKQRVANGNRIAAVARGDDKVHAQEFERMKRWQERFIDLEEEALQELSAMVEGELLWVGFWKWVRGVDKKLAGKILSLIDLERSQYVSQLWRFCGYAVINGERERPVPGERLHYCKRAKSTCYLMGDCFLKTRSPYAYFYYLAYTPKNREEERRKYGRGYYADRHPDWSDNHCHLAALRLPIKLALSHFYWCGRKLLGLERHRPWVYDLGNHPEGHWIPPERMIPDAPEEVVKAWSD